MCLRRFLAPACIVLLSLAAIESRSQAPFCLPDADGDGHPLFGNPEVHLNPFGVDLDMAPTSGAIGDLDGDGDLDAVASNVGYIPHLYPVASVSILLNHGDGTFTAVAAYDCGDYPSSVAIGDLNGDGLNDLAVTNTDSGQVSVLINAGGATFPTFVSYAVQSQPRSVVIADFDGVAGLDLAVANVENNSVSVLLSAGAGTFAPAVSYGGVDIPDDSILFGPPFAFGGPRMAAGDVDGDGDIDLAVPAWTGVAILANNGDGSFAAPLPLAAGAGWAVAVGDLNGDLRSDIVTAGGNVLSVLLQNTNGAFAPPVDYSLAFASPTGVYDAGSITLGDLDDDGDLDVAVGIAIYEHVLVFPNNGNGTFGPPTAYRADETSWIAIFAELNGDGHLDLAAFTVDPPWDKLCILLNDGTGSLITDVVNEEFHAMLPGSYWNHTSNIDFVDLDQDCDLDILVLNTGAEGIVVPNVAVVLNAGNGTFATPVHYFFDDHFPDEMGVEDMDGDGDPDVIVGGPEQFSVSTPGVVAILLNVGDGTLDEPVSYFTGGVGLRSLVIGDVDGDGHLDVVTANDDSVDLSALLNSGDGTLQVAVITPSPYPVPASLTIADLNGDQVLDLAVTKVAGIRAVFTMIGNADGTFTPGQLYELPPTVARVLAADFDADLDMDLVVSSNNVVPNEVTFIHLHNDGSGNFGDFTQYWAPGTSSARAMHSADIDRDGDLDLAVSVQTGIAVLLNAGDGTFLPAQVYGAGRDIQGLAAGDLNGDGRSDFGCANFGNYNYSLFWNRSCAGTAPVEPGDLDADGDVDLIDYAVFAGCLAGPGIVPGCCSPAGDAADINNDGDVDLNDVQGFQLAFAP